MNMFGDFPKDDLIRLYTKAACRNANPAIFDAQFVPDVLTALDYCNGCPVRKLCCTVVLAPHEGNRSFFCGVAGGRIWAKGKDITERVYGVIRWDVLEAIVDTGRRDVELSGAEKHAMAIALREAGYSSREIAPIVGASANTAKKYTSAKRLTAVDVRRAMNLGARIRELPEAA